MAYLAKLHEAGYLLAAGPLFDNEFRGLSLLNVDPERARELKEQDPAVRAGRFSVKVISLDGSARGDRLLSDALPTLNG